MTLTCQPPAPHFRTYPVRGIGVATVMALGATLVCLAAGGVLPLVAAATARRAQAGDDVGLLNQATMLDSLSVAPFLGALLVTGVLVMIWLYRARRNLDAMPVPAPGLRAGWAVGGWFVPLANLVVPARVMASVVRCSLPGARRMPALVWLWWITYVGGNAIDAVLSRRGSGAWHSMPTVITGSADYQAYIDYFSNEASNTIPGIVVLSVAGVLLSILVMRVSRAQTAYLAAAAPPPVPPGPAVAQSAPANTAAGTGRG